MELQLSEAAISGYLLALVRASAWLLIAPPFGGRTIPMQVKIGLAGALSLTVGPQIAEFAPPLDVAPLIGAVVMQVFAGVALGYIGVILFGAVQAAGGLIDSFSGFNMAQMMDPTSSGMTSVFGRFYQLLATTFLFAINGHIVLVRGFLSSFDATSLSGVDLERMSDLIIGDLGRFFVAALEIAAPLVAALLLTDLALGLLARAAPSMNVFVLGMPMKMFVTVGLAAVAIPLLPGTVEALIEPVIRQGFEVVGSG